LEQKTGLEQLGQNVLLRTKLAVPVVHACFLPRTRLTTQLNRSAAGHVTLISAPAGFGKTTLAARWVRQEGGPVAWLSLDEGDNDLGRFWQYVLAALQTATSPVGQAALFEPDQLTPETWEPFVSLLINEITAVSPNAPPITLVLDDYHLIQTHTIHQSLSFFLYHQPRSLHVIILTRADPPLALARLLVQGRLREIRAADLQFTQEEMAAFFDCTLTFALSPGSLATLARRIEGWAAGLQLAALSLKGLPQAEREPFIQAFSGAQRHVLHYLLEEVLQRQPEPVQSFLLQTAVLPQLTPDLCTAVTGQANAGQILARLANEELFISPVDDTGQWYRYHHLFAGALRSYLEQKDPDKICELKRRAAAWYTEKGLGKTENQTVEPLLDPLTERELEILTLVAQGFSNKKISDRLVISVGTVKGHINHLLSKLNAQNRTEAVAHAQRLGVFKT
jgi:LuxR family transcriptional regulator, maltose regulon positive regulatory protein